MTNLDWLLRNVNAIVTGEARFRHLHDTSTTNIQGGLARAEQSIDYALNLIAGDRVLFDALPIMSRITRRGGHLADVTERDRLLYWYFHADVGPVLKFDREHARPAQGDRRT